MIAEILCIGTELLMGQVLNTNAQFLSRRLSALGISQYHQSVVGDNAERLEAAYRLALSRADVVITSGGLGPTVDDITKRVAAKVAGQELVLFPEAEAMIRERFRQYRKEMTANNLSQAMFTPDTTLLMNPNGTAPGAIVPMGGGKVVIHLMVEGAITLYEDDAESICSLTLDQTDKHAAIAYDTIGTALYGLREKIRDMQTEYMTFSVKPPTSPAETA